jgi:signal transduction histidine kinase
MLDVATLEAGRFQVNPSPCAPDELLKEVSDVFGELAAAKQIRLDLSAKSPLPTLLADRARVLEALSNLIGNAFKFTPPGGRVAVSVEPDGDMVRFAVADSGPGIARDHIAHLFDRFWKHETSGKKGTGLGLFIVKGIVEAHGGDVWVESEAGRGATFFFTLPVATPTVATRRGPIASRPTSGAGSPR